MHRAVLLCVALLAGCAAPAESLPEPSCEERFAGPRGENALLIGTLQDEPDATMQRMAAAMGDGTVGVPRADADALVWRTEDGEVRYVRSSDAIVRVDYVPSAPLEEAPGTVLGRVLDAFFVPPEVRRDGARAHNIWAEQVVNGTSAFARADLVSIGPLYAWSPRAEALDASTLAAKAQEAAACVVPGASGEPAARSLDVVEESVSWLFQVGPSHGACALVHIDAQTGTFTAGRPCGAPVA